MNKHDLIKKGYRAFYTRFSLLPFHKQKPLLEKLVAITRRAFGTPIPESEVEKRISCKGTKLMIITFKDKPVGFMATKLVKINQHNILDLSGAAICPEHQKNGIYKFFRKKSIADALKDVGDGSSYVFTATQNPNVAKALRDFNISLFSEEAKTIIKLYCAHHKISAEEVSPGVFVHKGRYGSQLYAKVPRSSDLQLNEFFDKHLTYEKGDAFLLAGPATQSKKLK